MRSVALASFLLVIGAGAAAAQARSSASFAGGDAALTYHLVRTNTLGSCGCFYLNGGGLSASWVLGPKLAVVGEFSVEHSGLGASSSGGSLTLTSYLLGARYLVHPPFQSESSRTQPFVQLLVGAAHAGGGSAGVGDATHAFVGRLGGGIDYLVSPRIGLRVLQVDYDLTAFGNTTTNHQNNILLGAGVIYRWSR